MSPAATRLTARCLAARHTPTLADACRPPIAGESAAYAGTDPSPEQVHMVDRIAAPGPSRSHCVISSGLRLGAWSRLICMPQIGLTLSWARELAGRVAGLAAPIEGR